MLSCGNPIYAVRSTRFHHTTFDIFLNSTASTFGNMQCPTLVRMDCNTSLPQGIIQSGRLLYGRLVMSKDCTFEPTYQPGATRRSWFFLLFTLSMKRWRRPKMYSSGWHTFQSIFWKLLQYLKFIVAEAKQSRILSTVCNGRQPPLGSAMS